MWLPGLHKLFESRIERLWRKGCDPNERVKVAAAYVRLRPGDPHGWALWGNVLNRVGRYEEAEQVLRRALSRHPRSDPDIGWVLARVLSEQGRHVEARRLLSEQAEIFPDSRLPPLGLAEVALRERRWNDAIAYAEESLARSSSIDAVAKYETALVLAPIRTARDRAVSLLRDVVEVAPNEPLPNVTLGELLELDGDPDAPKYVDRARSTWKAPIDFDEFLRDTRESLRKSRQEDPDLLTDGTP